MRKMRNKETQEMSWFDEEEIGLCKERGVKLITKYKRTKVSEVFGDLIDVEE